MIEFKVDGLAELKRQMQELPAILEGKILTQALREGGKVIAEEARSRLRQNSSVDTSELLKSIRVKLISGSKKYGVIRMNVVAGSRKAYYVHMVERGTVKHLISASKKPLRVDRRGRLREVSIRTLNRRIQAGVLAFNGKILGTTVVHPGAKPKPFFRPAVNAKVRETVERVAQVIRSRVPREIKRQERRARRAA